MNVFFERETMREILEMADRLGQLLGRTDEYQAVKRAVWST